VYNIRAELARMNTTKYAVSNSSFTQCLSDYALQTDYDLNIDLYSFTTMLNDGHTRWFPNCYNVYVTIPLTTANGQDSWFDRFENLLPTPIAILNNEVYVVPDAVQFVSLVGVSHMGFHS
jgi:hypothetical protein